MREYKLSNLSVGKPVSRTKKINRFFSLAKNVAESSEYGKIRHGALLVKGGSVLNVSCNKEIKAKALTLLGSPIFPEANEIVLQEKLGNLQTLMMNK